MIEEHSLPRNVLRVLPQNFDTARMESEPILVLSNCKCSASDGIKKDVIKDYTKCLIYQLLGTVDTTYYPKILKVPSASHYTSFTHLLVILILPTSNPSVSLYV